MCLPWQQDRGSCLMYVTNGASSLWDVTVICAEIEIWCSGRCFTNICGMLAASLRCSTCRTVFHFAVSETCVWRETSGHQVYSSPQPEYMIDSSDNMQIRMVYLVLVMWIIIYIFYCCYYWNIPCDKLSCPCVPSWVGPKSPEGI